MGYVTELRLLDMAYKLACWNIGAQGVPLPGFSLEPSFCVLICSKVLAA